MLVLFRVIALCCNEICLERLKKEAAVPLKDLLIALVVIVAWGVNFVVIKVGLDGLPPMLLGALRFLLVAFPAVLLVRRPKLPWRWHTWLLSPP